MLFLLSIIIFHFLPSGSGGKPFGDNERDKWYVLGAVAAVAFLATVTMVEMGYKEIGWKEFVHRYSKMTFFKFNIIQKIFLYFLVY